MRLFKIQNFVPKLKKFRINKKRIGIQNPGYRGYPLIPCLKSLPPLPTLTKLEPTLTNVDGCDHPLPGYIFRPVDHVHKSGMPNFAHCRHAVTISSSPSQTHPLTGDLHLGTLICWRERGTICWRGSDENCWRGSDENCWRGKDENCWRGKDENCWREMKVGPEGGRVWF